MSFPLIPRYAVLDAKLTYSLPKNLTATTGMDALTHATEAYIGRSTTSETRQLAVDAVRLIFDNIKAAYSDGENEFARKNMLIAAYKAGIAFSKSYVGYIHAIAHSLGGQYGIPHGLANSVIMPYVLEAYGKKAHKKLYRLAIAAGVCSENDSIEVGAEKYIDAIKTLNKEMNIPDKLGGIIKEDIPVMARYAEKEANPLYPVPKLMTKKELESMTNEQIASLLDKQREYYKSGVTVPVNFRIEQLKKLYAAIKKYENEILQALHTDLGKSDYESFMCEIGLVLSEICKEKNGIYTHHKFSCPLF